MEERLNELYLGSLFTCGLLVKTTVKVPSSGVVKQSFQEE
jgi:hypothetical protein